MTAAALADPPRGDLRRWLAAGAIVLAAHLALGLLLQRQVAPVAPPGAPADAVLIDLAPPPEPLVEAPIALPPPPELPPPAEELVAPLPEPVLEPLPEIPPLPPELTAPLPEPPPQPTELVAAPLAPPPQPRVRPRPPPLARRAPPEPVTAAAPPAPSAASSEPRAAAPPAPPRQAEAPGAAELSYQGLLLQHLERHKQYPRAARLRRQEGTAQVRFTMDRDGKILWASVERSSGHEPLDEATLTMLERAQPLPPIPPELRETRLELLVPVVFQLR